MASSSCNELAEEDYESESSNPDEIEPNLFLGALTAATDVKWLKNMAITHILTADSYPLPRKIQLLPNITTKHIQITDMPREDFIIFFGDTYQFINDALELGGRILVHCYYGVSRSATLVIAYIMKKRNMSLDAALEFVKSKRRFVCPNVGFLAQLKLYEDMGCSIESENILFKIYRLQIAAEKVCKAKILPSNFTDVIKPDPALITVRPEPTVYRCKKCRRIVANASNILPHIPHERQIWDLDSINRIENIIKSKTSTLSKVFVDTVGDKDEKSSTDFCTKIHFIEPLAWMTDISHNVEGKLSCPECSAKLGSYNWISGCQCPCGTKITPAFYLVPSKVDWSNAVQNVLVTV